MKYFQSALLISILLTAPLLSLIIFPNSVDAQCSGSLGSCIINLGTTFSGLVSAPSSTAATSTLTSILIRLIQWLLALVGILATVAFFLGALMLVISIGDEQKAAQAKKVILYAIIGLIFIGSLYAVITAIRGIIGI